MLNHGILSSSTSLYSAYLLNISFFYMFVIVEIITNITCSLLIGKMEKNIGSLYELLL